MSTVGPPSYGSGINLAQHPNVRKASLDALVRRLAPHSMDPETGEELPTRSLATVVERELAILPDEHHHHLHEPEIPYWRGKVIRHLEERFGDYLCPTVTAKEVSREFDAGQANLPWPEFVRAVAYRFRQPEFAAKYLLGGDPVELDPKTGIFSEDGVPPAGRDVFAVFQGKTSYGT